MVHARRNGLISQLTRLYQRLPNQPQIPTRVLDDDSNASEGGYGDEDENNEDQDATGDEDIVYMVDTTP